MSAKVLVSVPYEITLLSNTAWDKLWHSYVSVPYEITLLSNINVITYKFSYVSVPYEITLLSNVMAADFINAKSFSTL